MSWADLFIGYSPWLAPSSSREAEFLPGHNTSYKRAVLLEYGDQLDSMMQAETVLHWNLRSKGHHLFGVHGKRRARQLFSLVRMAAGAAV